jgi:hypothetical protein
MPAVPDLHWETIALYIIADLLLTVTIVTIARIDSPR